MALHHPILAPSHVRPLSKMIEQSQPTDTLALRFCLAACSMIENLYYDLGYDSKIQFYSNLTGRDLENRNRSHLERLDMNLHMFPFIERIGTHPGVPHGHDPGSPIIILLHMAYKVLPVIYYDLVWEIQNDKLKDPQSLFETPTSLSKTVRLPLPPTTFTIPFSSFMQIPLPYSLGSAEMFTTCHLAGMTSPYFIESGEWTGYFGGQLHRPLQKISRARFELPMEGIQFSVSPHKGDPGILDLRSVGRANDDKGEVYFEGELWKATGKINLRRWYQSFPLDMSLQALMTPFGIVASWGVAEGYWM